jgi:hypothetical protein
MRRIVLLVIAPLAFLSAACGTTTSGEPGPHPPPGGTAPDPNLLYEANTIVLEDGSHGPMLCLGGVLESFPPQCGDVPAIGWDWAKVDGEEAAGGATWGSYHVVGKYDGETFVVTQVRPYREDDALEPDFSSPCDEPSGGWTGHATQDDDGAATEYARAQPDYVTSWVTHVDPPAQERSPVILNVVFTGDAERHETAIRELWDGPVCVVARDVPNARELGRIRQEAETSLDDLGLQMLWSAGPGVEPIVEIGVVADPAGKGQAAFDERYGAGIVRVQAALQPAS